MDIFRAACGGEGATLCPFLLTATTCYVCDDEEELFLQYGRPTKIFRAGPFPWQTDTPRAGNNRIWDFSETSLCYRYFSRNSQNIFELSKVKNTYIRLTLILPLVVNGMCYTSQINTFRGTEGYIRKIFFQAKLQRIFLKVFKNWLGNVLTKSYVKRLF